jgi:hypothetical protein
MDNGCESNRLHVLRFLAFVFCKNDIGSDLHLQRRFKEFNTNIIEELFLCQRM